MIILHKILLFFTCACLAGGIALGQETAPVSSPANTIKISCNWEVDVVYHTLAHFPLPGNPANLHSTRYVQSIQKAKRDLEVGPTRLDQEIGRLVPVYQKLPSLQFLNLAFFMADDFASFKQALFNIDTKPEELEEPAETLAQRRERDKNRPLLFGNARRLIPAFQKRFNSQEERDFIKSFAACLEEEYNRFYRPYRESRQEIDEASLSTFERYWNEEGRSFCAPWVARGKSKEVLVYLCPVMKRVGRGVPVTLDQQVQLNIVAPLPDTREAAILSSLIVLHESIRPVSDEWVEALLPKDESQSARIREYAAFSVGRLFLRQHIPGLYSKFLKFFLDLPSQDQRSIELLEKEFEKAYPLPGEITKVILERTQKVP